MKSFFRVGSLLVLSGALAAEPPPPQAPASHAQRLAAIEASVQNDPVLAGINADEAIVAEIAAQVLAPWRQAWLAGEPARFPAPLGWAGARELRRESDGIREYAWRPGPAGDALAQAREYLAAFERVVDLQLDALKLTPVPEGAQLEVGYDLRALTRGGGRRHDRGTLRLALAREGARWRLRSLSPLKLESLESDAPAFIDASAAWGLGATAAFDRREAIRRGGYAIAVADFDGDNRPDLLVGGWGPVKLLRNAGDRFEDVTAKAGLAGETLVKSAAFVDLDNDGRRDLLLVRFVEDGDKNGDLIAYRNEGGGRLRRVAGALTRTRKYERTMPLTVADFDRNGTLDLYLGFPGSRDFTTQGDGPQTLAKQGVWLNDGKWNFTEVPKESAVWKDENIYPHSALAADLDGDGWPDLVVANDRAGLSPIYRNRGGGMFEEISQKSGIVNRSWAMTFAAGDYDGDGLPDLAVTNIDFLASRRILASREGRESGPAERRGLEGLRFNSPGNRLFRNRGDGTFEETSDKAGLRWAGEAAAGAAWIDTTNSGRLDLYVMNGLWTGGPRDISSVYVRALAHRQAGYVEPVVDGVMDNPLTSADEFAGPNPLLGILRNVRDEKGGPALSMAGGQRNRLFRNNGDGSFTEVGFLLGLDGLEDGYVAAVADVDGDGAQDLLLRHADPAPGLAAPEITLLLNKNPSRRRSLSVRLEGARSNRDGIGATVSVEIRGRRLVREVAGPLGASQGEPVAFFGLGRAEAVDRLEVRWPSGLKEEFSGVAAGRVVLREGKGFTRLAAR